MSESLHDQSYLDLWQAGDQAAAQKLFDRYVNQVMKMARNHINRRLAGRVDAEDIVQSVFRTFFQRARKGQFHVEGADDLCKLLARITVRKTFRQIAYHKRAKRDAGAESSQGDATQEVLLNKLESGPSPDEAAAFLDYLEHFLGQLRPEDRQILELRMEGYNNMEIAEKLGISDRKIRRLLERMRGLAEQEGLAP